MIRLQWGVANGPGFAQQTNASFMVARDDAVALAQTKERIVKTPGLRSPSDALHWLAGTVSAAVCLDNVAGRATAIAASGRTRVLVWRDDKLVTVGADGACDTTIGGTDMSVATMPLRESDRILLGTGSLFDAMPTVALARLLALIDDPVSCARVVVQRAARRAGGRSVTAAVVDVVDPRVVGDVA